MEKILSREAVRRRVAELRAEGKTIVFTNGCFDILHVGHVRYLREAKKAGDVLVLGLNSDASVRAIKGHKRPLVPQEERADILAELSSVDYVTIFDEPTPQALIEELAPDVLVKGGDWREEEIAGAAFVRGRGGKVMIVPLTEGRSTTNVVEKIRSLYG
ncbi:MAG TPA: D-glycero-beta-D-manno-heptose 1-phosphate adenylyltransferase [Syntrophales bacterium]|mgnify:CR=1 FL=1|nr:D-glycero-beta-D-manno-heptose 1-phosphate adenylyltransferase [Syntrophales bacterium]HOM07284.1 D-glycero-beta-D-manno-heptose 1-phosphate adenylyltransferase [Syntrophales bacterium]HOO00157.1 D-glycero-beta-D-manno-heptose 1-phosphate adenylyltransferase [Syntrophales bacterium]HPC01334.1 D-glycero-beta-D-manno-heptose 1-phosphate adenylyltransferase [Syntrophales bacterium]HPQ06871.1 D-glycero-beta-D-manno-heptose 1-phosphate adenylyltransferase [Syntrophales bacterium]